MADDLIRERIAAVEQALIRTKGMRRSSQETLDQAWLFVEMLAAALSVPFEMRDVNTPSPSRSRAPGA